MFLGHTQESAAIVPGHPETQIFLRQLLGPTQSLQKHRRVPAFLLELPRPSNLLRERREPTISLQEHPEFLNLLGDERFRQELKADPVEVLARFGIQLSSSEVPQSVELPRLQQQRFIVWAGLF